MQTANEQTVLGDFDNKKVTKHGETFEFYRKNEGFYVRTDNIDGDSQAFKISHTFGVTPLQQYLIEFPNGAKQALSMAWDSRPKEDSGQRWFHLYPDDAMPSTDPLHWTRLHQNWNYQCADCHSTDLEKNYSADDATYSTAFKEINVACEACHGPAPNHVDWANSENKSTNSTITNFGFNASMQSSSDQLFSCARCHSRRRIIAESFEPADDFYDHYVPAVLSEGLYHPDGQILDEVYVYGSFTQSKMFQKGVICSNCHNPHTAELKLPGNAVCTQCHQSSPPSEFNSLQAKIYDSTAHHFHPAGSEGAQCRNCHMPTKTYMGVDERYDHSFRIPRPLISEKLGSPNTCNSCHQDKSAQWAQNEIERRFTKQDTSHFGHALAAGWQGKPWAGQALAQLAIDKSQPDIVRASALSALSRYVSPQTIRSIRLGLEDQSPAVQLAALQSLQGLALGERWQLASPLLTAPQLAVRIEAARALADVDIALLPIEQRTLFNTAIKEYIASQALNADRPEAVSNLAHLYSQRGDTEAAEKAYQQAITLDVSWLPAYLNLADMYRSNGRDAEGEAMLLQAIKQQPDSAESHHAYGLWLARQQKNKQALEELGKAANLQTNNWQYRYVYAIALNSNQRADEAIDELKKASDLQPTNPDLLFALATIHRDQGKLQKALNYANILKSVRQNDPAVNRLISALQARLKN